MLAGLNKRNPPFRTQPLYVYAYSVLSSVSKQVNRRKHHSNSNWQSDWIKLSYTSGGNCTTRDPLPQLLCVTARLNTQYGINREECKDVVQCFSADV